MFIYLTTFMFGLYKLNDLAMHKNPSVTSNQSPLEAGTKLNLSNENFMMAFSVTSGSHTGLSAPKTDPQYLQWMAIL